MKKWPFFNKIKINNNNNNKVNEWIYTTIQSAISGSVY